MNVFSDNCVTTTFDRFQEVCWAHAEQKMKQKQRPKKNFFMFKANKYSKDCRSFGAHISPNMSFQAYLDNIQAKTGKSPADFTSEATAKGFLKDGQLTVKATEITNWLKDEYALGHGHAMAIFALLKGKTAS